MSKEIEHTKTEDNQLVIMRLKTEQLRKKTKSWDDFKRMLNFGLVDSGLLLMSLLGGFSLDGWIAKHVGARV